jgi:hypothetical protein
VRDLHRKVALFYNDPRPRRPDQDIFADKTSVRLEQDFQYGSCTLTQWDGSAVAEQHSAAQQKYEWSE